MAAIYINGNLVAPSAQREGGSQYKADASGSNYILIHVNATLNAEQHRQLEQQGVHILKYVGPDTYSCFYANDDLSKIRDLGFVEYANVYHSDLVVNNLLKAKCDLATMAIDQGEAHGFAELREPAAATDSTFDIFVILHGGADRTPEQIKQALVSDLQLDAATIETDHDRLRMRAKATDIQQIARLDEVATIEEVPQLQTHNHVARQDLGFVDYAHLPTGVGVTDYSAQSVIVAVGDTGFDVGGTIGSAANPHVAFQARIKAILQENTNNPTNDDIMGHGTHVCGSIACNLNSTQFGSIKGTAPAAELIIQSMNDLNGSLHSPTSLESFLDRARNLGARVHSNSWGATYQRNPPGSPSIYNQIGYTPYALDIDTYMYKHPECLVIFAAGNDQGLGPNTDTKATVGGEATAKNCLTVGACESTRTMLYRDPSGAGYKYSASGSDKGDKDNVSDFSNIGPTRNTATAGANNSRNKPDVVAPGTIIYSTRSHRSPLLWMLDLSQTPPKTYPPDFCGTVTDNNFAFLSGTSMATPLVSGCAAILSKLLLKRMSGVVVTGALIKALLINGTDDMQGNPGRGPSPIKKAPDIAQGFGRVNFAATLRNVTDTVNCSYVQGAPLTQGGPPAMFPITIPAPTPKQNGMHAVLKATMCYNDPPGGSTDLVNVLNLHATDSSTPAKVLYANTRSPTVADGKNNVQKVVWEKISAGPAQLVVTCDAIRMPAKYPNQDFALAWSVEYVKDSGLSAGEIALIAGLGAAAAAGIVALIVALEHHH